MLMSESMVRSINEVAEHWLGVIESKLPSPAVQDHTKALVLVLAREVLNRWREASFEEVDGTPPAPNYVAGTPYVDNANAIFQTIYAQHKTDAQGAIIAIVELMEAIGNRRELPEQFKGLMT